MPDSIDIVPDLSLVIGPDDDATFISSCLHRNRLGTAERSLIYVVVHRRFGLWTHVYRVVPDKIVPSNVAPAKAPTRGEGLTVYLEKAIEGEAIDQARDWALGKFND
jgi:hypothetical protein